MTDCKMCGDCCKSFSIELFNPQLSVGQFMDLVEWLSRHKGTTVSKIDPQRRYCWLTVETPCGDLVDGLCGDYADRPVICRQFKCDKE